MSADLELCPHCGFDSLTIALENSTLSKSCPLCSFQTAAPKEEEVKNAHAFVQEAREWCKQNQIDELADFELAEAITLGVEEVAFMTDRDLPDEEWERLVKGLQAIISKFYKRK